MDAAIIDTDILSEVLKRRNSNVVRHAAAYLRRESQFAISAITRFELLRGLMERGATAQLKNFQDFCQRSLVLPIDDAVLDLAASLWVYARQKGLPSRDADLIIAATALASGIAPGAAVSYPLGIISIINRIVVAPCPSSPSRH